MINIWKIFGLNPSCTVSELDSAYIEQRSKGRYDKDQLRLYWKILRDPFTSKAIKKYHDPKIIIEAGFFDDGAEPERLKDERYDDKWMSTPVHKIVDHVARLSRQEKERIKEEPAIILLSTGAFSPIHEGHLMMMENAKKELESRGRTVLGGYISPSHDKYVFSKYKDAVFFDAPHRLYLCEKSVAYSDWLMVDGWECRYNDIPITYTEVILRLKDYLKRHLSVEIDFEIFYVFGGDNAPFARLFIDQGGCVCVKRPSHEDRMQLIKHDSFIMTNNDIVVVDAFFDQPNISSTEVRTGKKPVLNSIEKLFTQWYSPDVEADRSQRKYAVRMDYQWSTELWERSVPRMDLTIASVEFVDKFSRYLETAFSNCQMPDKKTSVKVLPIELDDQKKIVDEYNSENNVINLDSCTTSEINLGFSRHFGVSDGQCRWEHLVSRPGSETIPEQFSKIPPGKYQLIDDDIVTGFTVNTVLKLAPPTIEVTKKTGLLQLYLEKKWDTLQTKAEDLVDINDLRDFLVGSKGGGLVVSLPNGTLCRAPYLLPYVSTISRASIPPSMEVTFSLQIWELNMAFHHQIGPKIELKDCEGAFVTLMKYIGFKDDDKLVDICRWHLNKLKYLARK